MKKVVLFLFTISLLVFSFFFVTKRDVINDEPVYDVLKKVQSDEFSINKYFIYGNHMNISGCINKNIDNELSLIFKNNEDEIVIESKFYKKDNKTCFILSDKNNMGINLDKLSTNKYLLLVKETSTAKNNYYTLKNNTEYKNLEYYTITKKNNNNKININFENNKVNYLEFIIEKSKLPDNVYDITIDPGHGGNDPGASTVFNGTKFNESELNLEIALMVKKELEKMGLKVKLTRDSDTYISPYGENGRANIPNDVKAKYNFSIHLNSSVEERVSGGVEIYVPNDIDYTLASNIAKNISDVVGYSKRQTNKVLDGVYYEYFTESIIENINKEELEKGNKQYDIKVGSPYMFMIREVGGISTYAYNDGRNKDKDINKYYNSNQTAESYLLELAYINYTSDLNLLINATDRFSHAVSSAIGKYLLEK